MATCCYKSFISRFPELKGQTISRLAH